PWRMAAPIPPPAPATRCRRTRAYRPACAPPSESSATIPRPVRPRTNPHGACATAAPAAHDGPPVSQVVQPSVHFTNCSHLRSLPRRPVPYTVNRMRKIPILVLILATNTWAAGTLHVMQSFGTGNLREGSDLYAGLILDSQGNLYGVAESGGTRGAGVVYELSPITGGGWTETVLYNFKGGTEDGASPHATLIVDSAGNLYGTTVSGGLTGKTCRTGCGTVFKLTPVSGHWQESVLHRFTGGAGGAVPYAGVGMDSAGNLYGATLDGGAAGGGAVYRLTPGSAGWEQSVLYSFQGRPDGSAPYPTPVLDAAGNLYGTTNAGGAHNLGIVYMLAPQSDGTWTEHVLHTFAGGADGANPLAGVILDRRGNLYGTTSYGGTANCGIAFKLVPNPAGGW